MTISHRCSTSFCVLCHDVRALSRLVNEAWTGQHCEIISVTVISTIRYLHLLECQARGLPWPDQTLDYLPTPQEISHADG